MKGTRRRWFVSLIALTAIAAVVLSGLDAAWEETLFGDRVLSGPIVSVEDSTGVPVVIDDRGVRILPGDRARVSLGEPGESGVASHPQEALPLRFGLLADQATEVIQAELGGGPSSLSFRIELGKVCELVVEDGDQTRRVRIPRLIATRPFELGFDFAEGSLLVDGRRAVALPTVKARSFPTEVTLSVEGGGVRIAKVLGTRNLGWSGSVPLLNRVRAGVARTASLSILIASSLLFLLAIGRPRHGRARKEPPEKAAPSRLATIGLGVLGLSTFVAWVSLPINPTRNASPTVESISADPFSSPDVLRLDANNALVVPGDYRDFELTCDVNLREQSTLVVRSHVADVDVAAGTALLIGTDRRIPMGFAREEPGLFERIGSSDEPYDFPLPGRSERRLELRSIGGSYSATLVGDTDEQRIKLTADRGQSGEPLSGGLVLLSGSGHVLVRNVRVRPLDPDPSAHTWDWILGTGTRALLALLLMPAALGLGLGRRRALSLWIAIGLPLVIALAPSVSPIGAWDPIERTVLILLPLAYALIAAFRAPSGRIAAMVATPLLAGTMGAWAGVDIELSRSLRAPRSDLLFGVDGYRMRRHYPGYHHLTHDGMRSDNPYLARHRLSGERVPPRDSERLRVAVLGGAEVFPREEPGRSALALPRKLSKRLKDEGRSDIDVIGVAWPEASSAQLLTMLREVVLDPRGLDAQVVVVLIDPLMRVFDPGSYSDSAARLETIHEERWRTLGDVLSAERDVRSFRSFDERFSPSWMPPSIEEVRSELLPFVEACSAAEVPIVFVAGPGVDLPISRDELRDLTHQAGVPLIWADTDKGSLPRVSVDMLTPAATDATVSAIATYLDREL